jgi:hypothetical protein
MKAAVTCSLLIVLALLASCATPRVQPLPAEQVSRSDLLSFIRDGGTTREEVLLKLGRPSAQFEGQRILSYQIQIDKEGAAHVSWPGRSEQNPVLLRWDKDIYSLVLVFGPSGVLERHSLVGAK